MSKIKIETLTSVHIGSGETLQYGTDFVKGKIEDEDILGIIDTRKIMNLIGQDHVSNWVAAIERKESTSAVVKQYAPTAKVEDYSRRVLIDWSDGIKNTDTLKELIHNGMGKPYIPGSSIKGAIRTAVLASLATGIHNASQKIEASKKDIKTGQLKLAANAKKIESTLFGADPNSDVFRFLQVGDAIFGDNYEVALRMVSINEREKNSFWDTSKAQLIEALPPDDETEFQMKISSEYYWFAASKWSQNAKNPIGKLPEEMQTLKTLFNTINQHTHNLVESEIQYWEDRVEDDDSGKVSNYIYKLNDILSIVQDCQSGSECVLRIGYGSGWRFITGAWAEELENFDSLVVPVSRPKNHDYEQYDFPKTRRVDDQCELLGFVKLSIQE